jgi:RNA polymerase sigma-70 factor (ECF subfamily)
MVTQRRPDCDGLELEEPLRVCLEAAQRAWPSLALDVDTFVAHLADRMPRARDVAEFLKTLHAADLYLACGCTHQLPGAIAAFERAHLAPAAAVIRRIDSSADFVDEVRQRLRERLLVGVRPRIADYAGAGALAGWVGVAGTRLALNMVRERRREEAARKREAAHAPVPPPHSRVDPVDARLRASLQDALRVALGRLAPPERRLLRMYYLERTNQDEIARRLQVHRRTVIRHLAVARDQLLQLIHQELNLRLPALDTRDRDSLFRALRSDIDVSLTTALRSRRD